MSDIDDDLDLDYFDLDNSMDDIEDLPEFLNSVPAGIYEIYVTDCDTQDFKATEKKPAKKAVFFRYKIAETVSLEKAGAEPVADGSMFSENFDLKHKVGKKVMKLRFKQLLGDIAGVPTCQLMEIVKTFYNPEGDGNTFRARLRTKTSNKDGETYENIQMSNVEHSENLQS